MTDVDDMMIKVFEDVGNYNWSNSFNMKAVRAARDELTSVGMNWRYRDLFVARMTINFDASFTEAQEKRLLNAIRTLVRKFYTNLEKEGFDDEAIAESARNIKLSLSS